MFTKNGKCLIKSANNSSSSQSKTTRREIVKLILARSYIDFRRLEMFYGIVLRMKLCARFLEFVNLETSFLFGRGPNKASVLDEKQFLLHSLFVRFI